MGSCRLLRYRDHKIRIWVGVISSFHVIFLGLLLSRLYCKCTKAHKMSIQLPGLINTLWMEHTFKNPIYRFRQKRPFSEIYNLNLCSHYSIWKKIHMYIVYHRYCWFIIDIILSPVSRSKVENDLRYSFRKNVIENKHLLTYLQTGTYLSTTVFTRRTTRIVDLI